ncbi:MAG TPA: methyltransferase [Candidatus Binataceae bacterium]|nr:methyltransferase [Candidatus Binataceae bacterium]
MSETSSEVAAPAELSGMTQLVYGLVTTQAIYVASKLAIADLVAGAPKTADELAGATKAHAPSLLRVLRMLTSVGVFSEDASGRFHQTRLSELLRSDHPNTIRALALLAGSPFFRGSTGELEAAVLSGRSGFERLFGTTLFEYFGAHPEIAAIAHAGMTSGSAIDAPAVVAAYDFSRFEQIVDIGGGRGALLHAILVANPNLSGILADQSAVIADASALRSGPLATRCQIVDTDFFTSVPAGADAYIMKWILHDWNDDDASKILKNCRRAIRPDGKLLIVDSVLKPSNEPDPGKVMDLIMLAMAPGGRERTEAEFARLLAQAGFSLTRVIPTSGALSIVESQPA